MPGTWTWTDACIFIGVFVFIRVAVIWMCTKAFIAMIPDGDCCPICDSATLPIARDGWWKVLGPRFRRSWCLGCGWEGVLRRSEIPDAGIAGPLGTLPPAPRPRTRQRV
jgi:hypothetical protein